MYRWHDFGCRRYFYIIRIRPIYDGQIVDNLNVIIRVYVGKNTQICSLFMLPGYVLDLTLTNKAPTIVGACLYSLAPLGRLLW